MSTYKKGNQYEGEVKKVLESEGWIVEGQHRRISFVPDKTAPRINPFQKPPLKMIMVGRDIFGCDVIAKKHGEKTLYIQVSTRPNKSHKIRQVMIYPWNHDHETVQLWLRTEGKREYEIFQAPDFLSCGTKRVI